MGADRLKKIKDNAKRNWNQAGERLLNPAQMSLFDAEPNLAPRSFKIQLKGKADACLGDELLLHSQEKIQFVTKGPNVVGECVEIPASILDALQIGSALCVEVIGIGTITNTIEVAPK